MKVNQLNISDWQRLMDAYEASRDYREGNGYVAIRIENTIFSTARHFGGMMFNGATYSYFEPIDPKQPKNPNGTPYVAWLMVREDFLQWVEKELRRKGAKRNGNA